MHSPRPYLAFLGVIALGASLVSGLAACGRISFYNAPRIGLRDAAVADIGSRADTAADASLDSSIADAEVLDSLPSRDSDLFDATLDVPADAMDIDARDTTLPDVPERPDALDATTVLDAAPESGMLADALSDIADSLAAPADVPPDLGCGATEICNGLDDNCNGSYDEGCSVRAMGIGFGVLGSVGQMTAAASADGFGFAWDDGLVAGSELYFARMAFDATIATPPTRLTTDTLDTRWASIASNGTTFGITYTSGGSYAIWFTEVDRDGGIVVAPAQADPVVSSLSETVAVGSEYFGVWHSIGVRDLIFARIQTVPVVAAIKTTYTGYFTSLFSDITHDGTRFAMTWNPGVLNRIVFAQMDGTLIGTWTDVAVTPSRRSRAAIRALGDRYLVAWMDSPSPVARIALLDRSGATVAGPTSLGAVECPTDPCWAIPRVAASDDEFGVAFPNPGGGWWFQRITRTGSTLGERFTLTTIEGQIGLAAAPGGRYMMAGHTANNVLGVVINRP